MHNAWHGCCLPVDSLEAGNVVKDELQAFMQGV